MRTSHIALSALLVTAATQASSAAPFELVAVYQNGDKTISVPIDPDIVLPSEGSTTNGKLVLQRVVARFSVEGFDGVTTAVFDRMTFGMRVSTDKVSNPIGVNTSGVKGDLTLFDWRDIDRSDRVVNFSIDAHGKFSQAYLCADENRLRQQKQPARNSPKPEDGKEVSPAEKAKKELVNATGYDIGSDNRIALFVRKEHAPIVPLTDEVSGSEILYSFCEPSNTNWNAVAAVRFNGLNPYGTSEATNAAALEALHKQRLANLLIKTGTLKTLVSDSHPVSYGLDDKDDLVSQTGAPHELRVFMIEKFRFSVMKTGGMFAIREESRDRVHEGETTMFDQDSRVAIEVATQADGTCPSVTDPPFAFTVQKTADSPAVQVLAQPSPSPTNLKANFRQPCKFTLSMNLKDYLDSNVSLNIIYKLHVEAGNSRSVQDVLLFNTSFRVAHLGTIASVPVYSEFYTAFTSKSLADVNASSSIPFSYAARVHGAGDTNNIAVTFPVRVGFNTRNYPDLAKQLSLFAAISVIFGTTHATPTPTVGAGFTILDTIHLSAAFDMDGSVYLLAGFSVNDIAKAFKQK